MLREHSFGIATLQAWVVLSPLDEFVGKHLETLGSFGGCDVPLPHVA